MTQELTDKYAKLSITFAGCIRDMQNDLKVMQDKGLPNAIIVKRESLINDLIDVHLGTSELIEFSTTQIENLNTQRRLIWKALDIAAKSKDANNALEICKTFTKRG